MNWTYCTSLTIILHVTLMKTSATDVKMLFTTTDNGPSQDYLNPKNDQHLISPKVILLNNSLRSREEKK